MKAMGYAKTVIESISGNESSGTLSWVSRSGDSTTNGSLNIKNIKVNDADKVDGIHGTDLAKKSDLLNAIYPVGSIYISTNNNSPQNFLGGTWVRIEGRFLLGAGSGYNANATGGEATHTLTTDEMPSHNHDISRIEPGSSGANYTVLAKGTQSANYWDSSRTYVIPNVQIGYRGGSRAHNNMPPYYVVYIRRRTA